MFWGVCVQCYGVTLLGPYHSHLYNFVQAISLKCGRLILSSLVIVSTGCIQWILWFNVRYAAAAVHREIFDINTLSRQLTTPASFTKFAGYLYLEVSFIGTEISLILKNISWVFL